MLTLLVATTSALGQCLPDATLAFTDTPETPVPSAGTVGDLRATRNVTATLPIQDLDVQVDLSHTYVDDLHIYVQSPSGTVVHLTSTNGGGGQNYANTWFDDEAIDSVKDGSAPFTGRYRPEEHLSVLNGEVPTGLWTLYIVDNANGDSGTLHDWTLDFDLVTPSGTDNDSDGSDLCFDCDDTDPTTWPGAPELCDEVDNDCNGEVSVVELDTDGDGLPYCGGDCNDVTVDIGPLATETCDQVDTDCDNLPDVVFDFQGAAPSEVSPDATFVYDHRGFSGPHAPGSVVTFTFEDRPAGLHELTFDLVIIDDWDGTPDGDRLEIRAGDQLLFDESFVGVWSGAQFDEDQSYDPPAGTFVDSRFTVSGGAESDMLYGGLKLPLLHDGGDLVITFTSTSDEPDEHFALDNVGIAGNAGIDEGLDCDGDGISSDEGDCDDGDNAIFPGAPELCDGLDNDCTGGIDDEDKDNDGQSVCDGDCDDDDDRVALGNDEVCDGVDNNCDGLLLDNEVDADGDGDFACGVDCDDNDPLRFPSSEELCDGIDNDCDDVVPANELDSDNDGVFECAGDCDDGDRLTYLGAVELCDGIDNDCDGTVGREESDEDGDGQRVCDGDINDATPGCSCNAPGGTVPFGALGLLWAWVLCIRSRQERR